MHGKGVLNFNNGDRYEGYFENNLFEGKGTLHFLKGGCIKGLFK